MSTPTTLHPEDALRIGQAVLVLVHRYDNPDRWGRHIITAQSRDGGPLPGGDWWIEFANCCAPEFRWRPDLSPVLGYARPDDVALEGLTRVTREVAEMTTARARRGDDLVSLWEFIGAQIIPLEWKSQFRGNDPVVLDRIEIWARQEVPA